MVIGFLFIPAEVIDRLSHDPDVIRGRQCRNFTPGHQYIATGAFLPFLNGCTAEFVHFVSAHILNDLWFYIAGDDVAGKVFGRGLDIDLMAEADNARISHRDLCPVR